jgi:Fe-S oxidoreductase
MNTQTATKTTEAALEQLAKRYTRLVGTSGTNLCTHCGWCIDACHVYLATRDPEMSPVAKAERVRRVLRRRHDWTSKVFPFWTRAKDLTETELEKWVELAFANCTLCERCVINCPLCVETPQLFGAVRGTLTALGKGPEVLSELSDAAIAREEGLDDFKGPFLEQIKELEKQVQERLGDPNARIPVDEPADKLYVPLSGAHTIVPPAVIFNAVGESWTMSMFEASNNALFLADVPRAKRIAQRILNEAERLNVKEIVVAECGHAYVVLRWEAPKWFGGPLKFKVRSILEVVDEYHQSGRLKLDPTRNPEPVTYHDPCNLGRKGGIFEEPRRLLRAATMDFRDMTPNRWENYCCGGGGGLVANEDWTDTRVKFGKVKAEQIQQTGATIAATSCDNCLIQISDLSEHYGLGVTVTPVSQLVTNALVT